VREQYFTECSFQSTSGIEKVNEMGGGFLVGEQEWYRSCFPSECLCHDVPGTSVLGTDSY
jgi:hypothetical protein